MSLKEIKRNISPPSKIEFNQTRICEQINNNNMVFIFFISRSLAFSKRMIEAASCVEQLSVHH